MARFRFALLAIFVLPSAAFGQPAPSEKVTVTGTKSREVIASFVLSLAKPTRMTGKIARWEEGICPITVGLRPAATRFVTQRLREVAAKVGAPVNGKESCKPNITILFTKAPQALLDNIRKNSPSLLGYYDNSDQLEHLASIKHPVQAWYVTQTKDVNGSIEPDSPTKNGVGLQVPCSLCPGGYVYLQNASAARVTGTRLGDGLRSGFANVIVVVDPAKLVDYEIGSIADYISMLALSQLNGLESCQELSSIVNMLAAGCERKPDTITDNDLGYLRGLYKMSSDRSVRIQQDEIAYQMEQSLQGR